MELTATNILYVLMVATYAKAAEIGYAKRKALDPKMLDVGVARIAGEQLDDDEIADEQTEAAVLHQLQQQAEHLANE